jgi:Pvc16 N-terminal domain
LATHHAITAIGRAFLGLLEEAAKGTELEGIGFKLFQAADFTKRPFDEGLSLYLYRLTISNSRRQLPRRHTPSGERVRPALPVDLCYLLTPWAKTAEKQHLILGWAMRLIEDTPILSSGILNKYGHEPGTFRPDETVDLVPDTISIQDMLNVWEVGKPNIQISMVYIARAVSLESRLTERDEPPVQTRVFGPGKLEDG